MTARRAFAAILAPVSLGRAQSPAPPEFEVASIKPNTSGGRGANFRPLPGGRLTGVNVPLGTLIRVAYNVRAFQISGAPAWLDTGR